MANHRRKEYSVGQGREHANLIDQLCTEGHLLLKLEVCFGYRNLR